MRANANGRGDENGTQRYCECGRSVDHKFAGVDAEWRALVVAARREGFDTKLDELHAACDESHVKHRADCAKAVDAARVEGLREGLQLGSSRGRCTGLWDAVEVAQEIEERRGGEKISEALRVDALHADRVKAQDEALIAKAEGK